MHHYIFLSFEKKARKFSDSCQKTYAFELKGKLVKESDIKMELLIIHILPYIRKIYRLLLLPYRCA